ncbi:hypothetical protein EDC54_10281 [Samsonia erythrinae]|uniref:Uncharacterized protein n=1 Tax=Samsonia erythrinae TaxID=160434 RepID=A0A4R3VLW0_9GAMM|nr:hypothetical protein EDC54_10281 [Samsonia erythrinae]
MAESAVIILIIVWNVIRQDASGDEGDTGALRHVATVRRRLKPPKGSIYLTIWA